MTNAARLVAVIAAVLAFGGCATDPGIRPFWTLHDTDFQQLKPGMTRSEVEKLVGKPILKITFPRLEEEVWEYNFLDVQVRMKAMAHFDTRGVLTYHQELYDHEYYSGDNH